MAYFYNEIGLEIVFGTTLQNRKPQMPSSAIAIYKLFYSLNLSLFSFFSVEIVTDL